MRITRTISIVIALGVIVTSAGGASVASASESKGEQFAPATCSSSAWEAGHCITTMWADGEDPLVEGTKQALARGEVSQVKTFVELRSQRVSDQSQLEIQELVDRHETVDARGAQSRAVQPMSGGDDGTAYGTSHELAEIYNYGTCTPGPECTTGGIISIQLNFELFWYPENTLSGWVSLNPGSVPIRLDDMRCETWYNNSPFLDIKVHDWGNCENAESPTFFSTTRNIFTSNWNQGGTIGKLYHNYYNMEFVIQGTSNPVGRDWRTQEYKVLQGGGASFNY